MVRLLDWIEWVWAKRRHRRAVGLRSEHRRLTIGLIGWLVMMALTVLAVWSETH